MDAGTRAWSMGGLLSPVVGGEGRTAKISAAITVAWNVAQAVASIVVLTMEWGHHCDQRLGLWLLVATTRIIIRIGLCMAAYNYYLVEQRRRQQQQQGSGPGGGGAAAGGGRGGLDDRNNQAPLPLSAERSTMIDKMKEVLDVFHLVWFTLGNAWVFGSRTCRVTAPLTFYLSLTIIVVTYAVMLFPIFLAVLLIPFACFCLPCVLRVLVRLREAEDQRGAPSAVIASIPSVKYQEGMFGSDDDSTCPICLTDYEDGDMLRVLKCSGSHHFHQDVCPCCREPPMGHLGAVRQGQQQQDGEDETCSNNNNNNNQQHEREGVDGQQQRRRRDQHIINIGGGADNNSPFSPASPRTAATAILSPSPVGEDETPEQQEEVVTPALMSTTIDASGGGSSRGMRADLPALSISLPPAGIGSPPAGAGGASGAGRRGEGSSSGSNSSSSVAVAAEGEEVVTPRGGGRAAAAAATRSNSLLILWSLLRSSSDSSGSSSRGGERGGGAAEPSPSAPGGEGVLVQQLQVRGSSSRSGESAWRRDSPINEETKVTAAHLHQEQQV